VSKGKAKSGRLSVFKGREARLNKAIFHILALKGPLTIYDIRREVRKQRLLHRKLYSVVSRRVRILRQQGYVEKVGTRKTQAGFEAAAYYVATRGYFALLLDQIDLEEFVKIADEVTLLTALGIFKSP
jgi:hypothetical protein